MKTLIFLFFFCAFVVHGQVTEPCYVTSEKTMMSLLETDIVELHFQLYEISTVVTGQDHSKENAHLGSVARGAVYALSNQFVTAHNWFTNCSPQAEEASREAMSQGTMFSIATNETVSYENWIKAISIHWPLKGVIPMVGHMVTNPEIRGKKLPFHPVIELVLKDYAGQSVDLTNPLSVAARELLGEKLDWEIKKFESIPLCQINKKNFWHSTHYVSKQTEDFRSTSFSNRLSVLAGFYEQ